MYVGRPSGNYTRPALSLAHVIQLRLGDESPMMLCYTLLALSLHRRSPRTPTAPAQTQTRLSGDQSGVFQNCTEHNYTAQGEVPVAQIACAEETACVACGSWSLSCIVFVPLLDTTVRKLEFIEIFLHLYKFRAPGFMTFTYLYFVGGVPMGWGPLCFCCCTCVLTSWCTSLIPILHATFLALTISPLSTIYEDWLDDHK